MLGYSSEKLFKLASDSVRTKDDYSVVRIPIATLPTRPHADLSELDIDMLTHLSKGHTARSSAALLKITESLYKMRIRNLRYAFLANSAPNLVFLSLQHGIIDMPEEAPIRPITPEEANFVGCVALGMTNSEISRVGGLPPSHMYNLDARTKSKLGVSSRQAVVTNAIARGIL